MTHVVLWDFDGTLARRPGMWRGALLDALRTVHADTDLSEEELRPFLRGVFPWHHPDVVRPATESAAWWAAMRPVFLAAYRGVGVAEELAEQAIEQVGPQYYRADAWELIDGAVEALRLTADAGYRNAILSNHGPELPDLVTALGLDAAIEQVFTSAALGVEKPNPLIFEHALSALGADGDRWMVGDNPVADIEGARAVGLRAILADGAYADARGVTVLQAARQIVG